MTTQHLEFDKLRDNFGITFGLGIDFETQYEQFLIYSACGGQEGDISQVDINHPALNKHSCKSYIT